MRDRRANRLWLRAVRRKARHRLERSAEEWATYWASRRMTILERLLAWIGYSVGASFSIGFLIYALLWPIPAAPGLLPGCSLAAVGITLLVAASKSRALVFTDAVGVLLPVSDRVLYRRRQRVLVAFGFGFAVYTSLLLGISLAALLAGGWWTVAQGIAGGLVLNAVFFSSLMIAFAWGPLRLRWRIACGLAAGIVLVYAMVLAFLWKHGELGDAWFLALWLHPVGWISMGLERLWVQGSHTGWWFLLSAVPIVAWGGRLGVRWWCADMEFGDITLWVRGVRLWIREGFIGRFDGEAMGILARRNAAPTTREDLFGTPRVSLWQRLQATSNHVIDLWTRAFFTTHQQAVLRIWFPSIRFLLLQFAAIEGILLISALVSLLGVAPRDFVGGVIMWCFIVLMMAQFMPDLHSAAPLPTLPVRAAELTWVSCKQQWLLTLGLAIGCLPWSAALAALTHRSIIAMLPTSLGVLILLPVAKPLADALRLAILIRGSLRTRILMVGLWSVIGMLAIGGVLLWLEWIEVLSAAVARLGRVPAELWIESAWGIGLAYLFTQTVWCVHVLLYDWSRIDLAATFEPATRT